MQRSQAIMQAILRNPMLWGGLATAGFYAAIDAGLLEHPLVARYLAGHWAAYICVGMFFVGLAAIVLKALDLAGQFEALRLTYFDPAPQGQPMSDCGLLLARLDKQPSRVFRTYLFERLRARLGVSFPQSEHGHLRGRAAQPSPIRTRRGDTPVTARCG